MSDTRKQELCLDAIEHSFRMAMIAYVRLMQNCKAFHDESTEILGICLALDAWSFIDVAKRLRSVLQQTPGVRNADTLTAFLRETEEIVDFRNYIQHLEERMPAVAQSGRPIWGTFSWVRIDPNKKSFEAKIYIPGRLAKTTGIPIFNPAGRVFYDEIDHFELSLENTTFNLSEMHRKIITLENKFTKAVNAKVTKTSKRGDTILLIDLDI